jgi:hypothetical protein
METLQSPVRSHSTPGLCGFPSLSFPNKIAGCISRGLSGHSSSLSSVARPPPPMSAAQPFSYFIFCLSESQESSAIYDARHNNSNHNRENRLFLEAHAPRPPTFRLSPQPAVPKGDDDNGYHHHHDCRTVHRSATSSQCLWVWVVGRERRRGRGLRTLLHSVKQRHPNNTSHPFRTSCDGVSWSSCLRCAPNCGSAGASACQSSLHRSRRSKWDPRGADTQRCCR